MDGGEPLFERGDSPQHAIVSSRCQRTIFVVPPAHINR
jgi:hypothetical protein